MTTTFSGGTIDGNILPSQTGYDLGNSGQRWDGFFQNVDFSGYFSGPGASVSVLAYGAVPDCKSVVTASVTSGSNVLTAPSATFTSADTGKTCIVRNQSTFAVVAKGTLTFVSSSQCTMSVTSSATLTGNAWLMWGTDNGTAIQNALTAAAALTTGPTVADYISPYNYPLKLGWVDLKFPTTSSGSAYLFTPQLTVARKVNINAEAMLVSAVGTKAASDRTFSIIFSPGAHCERLLIDNCEGMGVSFGTAVTAGGSYIGTLHSWHAGGDYDATKSPKSQMCVRFLGYSYYVNQIFTKRGNVGVGISSTDSYFNQIDNVGASTGLLFYDDGTIASNVHVAHHTADTVSNAAVVIEVGANLTGKTFMGGADGDYGIDSGANVGSYDVHGINWKLVINNSPVLRGLLVRNTVDSVFDLHFSNQKFSFDSATPITQCIEYGSSNSGFLTINLSYDGAIATLYSGTQFGILNVKTDTGTQKTYVGNEQVLELTTSLNKSIALSPFSAATAHGDATLYWAYNGTIGATTARSGAFTTVSSTGVASLQRVKATGTALVAGDFALHANWGAGATVTSVTGTDQGWNITVTAAGTPGASPTVILTFKDGTWTSAPIVISKMVGGTGAITDLTDSATATAWTVTFNGTPVAGSTYVISGIAMGR
jgi:hypothetical protein